MNTELSRKIDLFVKNREKLGKAFKLDYGLNCLASGLVLTAANADVDIDRMKDLRDILAGKAGVFSSFRATSEMAVLTKMYLSSDPETYIENVMEAYNKIKGKRILDTASMVLSAISVIDLGKMNQIDQIAAKTEQILRLMSKKHPFLTDQDDLTFAVLLAMTDKDVDTIISEMEECYTYLKKTVKVKAGANAIQSLCEIITLSDGPLLEKCDRAVELFNTFAAHGSKYGNCDEFSSLGALIGLDIDKDELVGMIIETADTLKNKKGFGGWDISSKTRLMFAAMLVAEVLSGSDSHLYSYAVTNALISTVISAIISMEVAVMVSTMVAVNSVNSY